VTESKDLEKRVIKALEKQYGETVYLNHVNVQGDKVHVEFKTTGGMMGLASFRFTKDTLVRL